MCQRHDVLGETAQREFERFQEGRRHYHEAKAASLNHKNHQAPRKANSPRSEERSQREADEANFIKRYGKPRVTYEQHRRRVHHAVNRSDGVQRQDDPFRHIYEETKKKHYEEWTKRDNGKSSKSNSREAHETQETVTSKEVDRFWETYEKNLDEALREEYMMILEEERKRKSEADQKSRTEESVKSKKESWRRMLEKEREKKILEEQSKRRERGKEKRVLEEQTKRRLQREREKKILEEQSKRKRDEEEAAAEMQRDLERIKERQRARDEALQKILEDVCREAAEELKKTRAEQERKRKEAEQERRRKEQESWRKRGSQGESSYTFRSRYKPKESPQR